MKLPHLNLNELRRINKPQYFLQCIILVICIVKKFQDKYLFENVWKQAIIIGQMP